MAARMTITGMHEIKGGARLSISEVNPITGIDKSWHYVLIPREGGFTQALSHMDTNPDPFGDGEPEVIPNEPIPSRHVTITNHIWTYMHSDWSK